MEWFMFEGTPAHLVQPPDQSKVSCEIKPARSGFCLVESWKTPEVWRLWNLCGQLDPLVDCSHGGKVFPCIKSNLLLSAYSYDACPPTLHHYEEPSCSSLEVLVGLLLQPVWLPLDGMAVLYMSTPAGVAKVLSSVNLMSVHASRAKVLSSTGPTVDPRIVQDRFK